MIAPGIAAKMFYTNDLHAFFGPLCSEETAAVADLASFWNVPILSGVSTSGIVDNKER